jgi:hypothetical protein
MVCDRGFPSPCASIMSYVVTATSKPLGSLRTCAGRVGHNSRVANIKCLSGAPDVNR